MKKQKFESIQDIDLSVNIIISYNYIHFCHFIMCKYPATRSVSDLFPSITLYLCV